MTQAPDQYAVMLAAGDSYAVRGVAVCTDDGWMRPLDIQRAMDSYSEADSRERRLKEPFLIQRQKIIMCSWMGDGPPTQWDTWATFATKDARDKELARLREGHPAWHLRARQLDPLGRIMEPHHIDWP